MQQGPSEFSNSDGPCPVPEAAPVAPDSARVTPQPALVGARAGAGRAVVRRPPGGVAQRSKSLATISIMISLVPP